MNIVGCEWYGVILILISMAVAALLTLAGAIADSR